MNHFRSPSNDYTENNRRKKRSFWKRRELTAKESASAVIGSLFICSMRLAARPCNKPAFCEHFHLSMIDRSIANEKYQIIFHKKKQQHLNGSKTNEIVSQLFAEYVCWRSFVFSVFRVLAFGVFVLFYILCV